MAWLRALLLVVLPLAAIDSFVVRLRYDHWPLEARLFGQMLLLWGSFALLALLPALWTRRILQHRRGILPGDPETLEPTFGLTGPLYFWTAFPVLGHAALDRFTSVGKDLGGLLSVWPWLALVATCVVTALVAGRIGWLLEVSPGEAGSDRADAGRRASDLADPDSRTPRSAAPGKVTQVVAVGGGPVDLPARRRRTVLTLVMLASLVLGLLLPRRPGYRGPELAEAAERPNLVLLVWDTVRARSLESYGYDRSTSPNLAALAERGTLFGDARSVSCFTFTSHLSLLSGVYPSEHGAWLLNLSYDRRRADHLAAVLNQAGYRTGAFVGTDVLSGRTGIDWGFEVYDDLVDPPVTYGAGWALVHDLQSILAELAPALSFNGRPHWFQDFQRPADEALARAQAWIESDDERPWFCMINMYDAHWPYLPKPEYAEGLVGDYEGPVNGFGSRSSDLPPDYQLGAEDDRHLTDLYAAEIRELDAKVGAFLAAIDDGALGIVVTSDHGEAFGEGGEYEHNDILEPQVRVPLLVVPPADFEGPLVRGGVVASPVSGIDVAPTLLGLAGLPRSERMRGVDLTKGPPPAGRLILVEDRDHLRPENNKIALYRDGFKFVRKGAAGAYQADLHELASDPDGLTDVLAAYPELGVELARLMNDLRAEWGGDAELTSGGADGGAGLGALGYLDE